MTMEGIYSTMVNAQHGSALLDNTSPRRLAAASYAWIFAVSAFLL
jgi:hypothetical protein